MARGPLRQAKCCREQDQRADKRRDKQPPTVEAGNDPGRLSLRCHVRIIAQFMKAACGFSHKLKGRDQRLQ
jgi:hypothetical protein